MKHEPQRLINDHFFIQALSCPLKIPFLEERSRLAPNRPVYRRANKLHLRDAIATRYGHRKYTAEDTEIAASETKKWLTRDSVTICGAVLQTEVRQTRIPILIKEKEKFTIVQVHGKLRKKSEQKALRSPGKRKSTAMNLLKAAYRTDVLLELFPKASFEIHFFFPDKHFRSSVSHLHTRFGQSDPPQEVLDQLRKLFLRVVTTEAVKKVMRSIPENIVHAKYYGCSVQQALKKVLDQKRNPEIIKPNTIRHSGCSSCEYRHSGLQEKGCWEKSFEPDYLKNPHSHVYDLIGHGNQYLIDKNVYYQEQVEITDGLQSVDLMKKYGGSKFTIQQRRNLQILKSKREAVPLIWLRKGVEKMRSLIFPLHFIDFEAATYAIPMRRGTNPYTPLYFQFSCHTLNEDRSVTHSTWLQKGSDTERVHIDFVENIASIKNIFQGTIIHFSPFEKQALNRLTTAFKQNSMLYSSQIDLLNRIKEGQKGHNKTRFFDLSELVRDYYYNCELKGSLGIKDVLLSILKTEQKTEGDSAVKNLFFGTDKYIETELDPYIAIQDGDSLIMDGAAAMHAWISQKNGLLPKEKSASVSSLLENYCTLDSLSMLAVFNHIERFYKVKYDDDVLIF